VKIDLVRSGDYPGDGVKKPVSFPDPASVSDLVEGLRVIRLAPLVELKLASGMSAKGRIKDLADVQELIKANGLGPEFAERLHPWVREKFREMVP
jgi:hypothetical protein